MQLCGTVAKVCQELTVFVVEPHIGDWTAGSCVGQLWACVGFLYSGFLTWKYKKTTTKKSHRVVDTSSAERIHCGWMILLPAFPWEYLSRRKCHSDRETLPVHIVCRTSEDTRTVTHSHFFSESSARIPLGIWDTSSSQKSTLHVFNSKLFFGCIHKLGVSTIVLLYCLYENLLYTGVA